MTFAKRTVDARGRALRYLEAAPEASARGTLVLLHAFPLTARMWEPQLPLAASGWRTIAPQYRQFDEDGAGEPAATSMVDYADDVISLLGALSIPSAVIAGLSMGGYVAFAILRRAPQLVQALVLADTRPDADTAEGVEGRKKMLALARDKGVTAVADEMIAKLLPASTRTERPEIAGRVRDLILTNSSDAIMGAITALMTRPDSTPLLAGIRCPVAILVGAEDSVTPPSIAGRMHEAVNGSQLSTIAAAGHLSNIERPDAFNRSVARFLDAAFPTRMV